MNHELTKQDENFISNMGIAGTLIAITCLIQHLSLMNEDNWISVSLIIVYVATILGYVLLMMKNHASPLLLLICAILLFITEALFIFARTYSIILLFNLMATAATVTYVYVSNIPAKLRAHHLAKKEEKDKWKEVI